MKGAISVAHCVAVGVAHGLVLRQVIWRDETPHDLKSRYALRLLRVRSKLMFLDCLRLNAATRHQVTAQGNALGELMPKVSPERAPHFVATKRKRIKSLRRSGLSRRNC
jgi:hypothetical protein